jgi:regulator of nucleoside diphosphate kinase
VILRTLGDDVTARGATAFPHAGRAGHVRESSRYRHDMKQRKKPMLQSNPPTMTEFDLRRLDALFERVRRQVKPPSTLSVLEREVERAIVVKPEEIPATVVTMNSRVEVTDLDTEEQQCVTLVFPTMASIETGCVSVLAPLGTALLGSQEGMPVAWHTPRGTRRLRVERVVYQPEAAGRFDL